MKNKPLSHIIFFWTFFIPFVIGSTNPVVPKNEEILISRIQDWAENHDYEEITSARKTYQFNGVNELIHSAGLEETSDEMTDIYRKREEYYGNPKVQRAKMFIDGLQAGKLLAVLTGADLVKMPIGFKKTYNGYTISVVFASAKIYPEYATLTVYGGVQKEGGEELLFGSDNIKFSYEGGIIGDGTLGLLADFPIKREGRKLAFLFKGFERSQDGNHRGSYMTIDCNGFVQAKVDGDVIISRDWVLPTDEEGKIIKGNSRVRANIALTVTDWSDIVAETAFPYFTLARDTSVAFLVDQAIVDFSDAKNGVNFFPPPEINIETGQLEYNYDEETANLWKGVYFRKIEVILPQVFDQSEGSLAFGAESLYFDSRGVTGKIYADHVLPIEKGELGKTGWAFGIDRLDMVLIYSQIYEFGFDGRMSIPISGDEQTLTYGARANLKAEIYNFNLGVDSMITIPMWDVVEVNLKQGTRLDVDVVKGEFDVQAVLCGYMNISMSPNENNKNTNLKIADIDFDMLIVDTKAPYVSLAETGGHITFTVGPILNNSFLTIDHAGLRQYEGDKVMFTMGMEAGVMDSGDGGAKTGGTFGMVGKPIMVNGRQKWVFDEMKLISLEIHLDFADAGYVKGGITFFSDDPIYGNGFYGYLQGGVLRDNNGYKFNLIANARFGTKFPETDQEYKYFSVDAYVSSSTMAVTIYPPIAANGFGGGLYHHMSMAGYDLDAMAAAGPSNPYSGIVYEPDKEIGLGLKATIGLTTTSGKAFQGVVTLELVFTEKLALAEVLMYGTGEISGSNSEGWVSKQTDDVKSNTMTRSAAIAENENNAMATKANTITCAAFFRISLKDGFEMHGSFKAFLDAAEGYIKGEGAIDMLASARTNKWHIYVGGYSDNSITNLEGEIIPPVTIYMNFKTFQIGARMYLMFGNDIPGPPPIDRQVAQFFGIPTTTNNRSGLNSGGRSAAGGTAAAFGASAYLDFQYRESGNKYVNVLGGAGFDLSLLSNSDLSRCSISGNSPQGQKGWRAMGRLYVYAMIDGKWKDDCWLCIPVTIPKQYIGLMVEGDVPNPDYFDVYLKVKIFSWLNINQQIEMGEKCGEVLN